MAWYDIVLWPVTAFVAALDALDTATSVGPVSGPVDSPFVPNVPPSTTDGGTDADAIRARKQLLGAAAVVGAAVAAPTIYALSKNTKKHKKKLTDKELMVGQSLENSSAQATGLLMTALAAPAISTAVAYILVQKLEDGKVITKGLGDATQGLLTVAAAGPALQGIGSIVGSAFKRGK